MRNNNPKLSGFSTLFSREIATHQLHFTFINVYLFYISKQILTDEIQDTEFLNFAVENISELFGYIATGRVNIRIHRDVTGDMWFGVG